jgi:hypothetical protein
MPDVCCLCGSPDHTVSTCPWKGKSMKLSLILLALLAPLLSGCLATLDSAGFTNRLMMSTACDEVRADSQWFGGFGLSSGIVGKDAKPVLDALCGPRAAAAK